MGRGWGQGGERAGLPVGQVTRLFHSKCSVQHITFCPVFTTRLLQISGEKATVLQWEGVGCKVKGEGKGGVGQVRGRSSVPLDVVWDCLQGLGRVSVHLHILSKTRNADKFTPEHINTLPEPFN